MLRIGLIVAPAFGERGSFVPLGLAYLNGALRHADFHPTFFDVSAWVRKDAESLYTDLVTIGFSPDEGGFFGPHLPTLACLATKTASPAADPTHLAQRIRHWASVVADRMGPLDLALLTLWDSNLYFALALGQILRQRGVTVVMGGPGAQLTHVRALLLHSGGADLILQGEGEERVVQVAQAMVHGESWLHLPGASYLTTEPRSMQVMVDTPSPPPLLIHNIPRPSFDGFGTDGWIPILSSRGCIRDCSFCTEKSFWKRYRVRHVDDVLDEIEYHITHLGTDQFEINDDLFNGNPRWLHRFCTGLKQRGLTPRWICFMEPYRLTHDMLDEVAAAGCVLIKYGVQHFDPEMLRLMGRGDEIESVTDTLRYTASLGIRVHFDLVPGHPGETEAHHATNLRVLPEVLDLDERLYVNINPFLLLYGSPVEQDPDRFNVTVTRWDSESLSAVLPTPSAVVQTLAPAFIRSYEQVPDRETVICRTRQLEAVVRRIRARSSYVAAPLSVEFSSNSMPHNPPKRWVWELSAADTPRRLLAQVKNAYAAGIERVMVRTPGPPFHNETFVARAKSAGLSGVMVYGDPVAPPTRQAAYNLSLHNVPTFFVERVWSGNVDRLWERVESAANTGLLNIILDFLPWLSETTLGPTPGAAIECVENLLLKTHTLPIQWAISGFPYCFLTDHVDLLAASPPVIQHDVGTPPVVQLPVCRFCALSNRCPGAPQAILDRFGPQVLVPQPGRPEGGFETDALARLFS